MVDIWRSSGAEGIMTNPDKPRAEIVLKHSAVQSPVKMALQGDIERVWSLFGGAPVLDEDGKITGYKYDAIAIDGSAEAHEGKALAFGDGSKWWFR